MKYFHHAPLPVLLFAFAVCALAIVFFLGGHIPQPCQSGLVDNRSGSPRDFTVYYGDPLTPLTDGTTSGYELLILEPQNFTPAQIQSIRSANPGAFIYGYVNGNAIEDWRKPYYTQAAGAIVGPYPGYPDEHIVDVNQTVWRDTVTTWIGNTVGTGAGQYGLDGVFMDNTAEGYRQYPGVITQDDQRDYMSFVRSWMDNNGYADKGIIANQGVEVTEANGPYPGLRGLVNGILYENLFSDYPAQTQWHDYAWLYPETLSVLDTYVAAGKLVLVLDCPYDSGNEQAYLPGLYCRGWERGYLVCASDSLLQSIHNNPYQPDGPPTAP